MGEYLVSFGRAGDFGRFRAGGSTLFRRGDRVVIHGPSGLETGRILCAVSETHLRFLGHSLLGDIVRSVTVEDEPTLARNGALARHVFDAARALGGNLPIEIVDVSVQLDGSQATVYHLRQEDCDCRDLVSGLARQFSLRVILHNMAVPMDLAEDTLDEISCGKPDCGQGNCTSCGTDGGCASCGNAEDTALELAQLRQKMEGCGHAAERTDVESYFARIEPTRRQALAQVTGTGEPTIMTETRTVCRVEELTEGKARTVAVGKKLIAVFCDQGQFFAIDDTCPHMGASLSTGEVENGIVTCPWHSWRFRLCDGVWADSPRVKIGSYPVRVVDGTIQIDVPAIDA